MSSDADLRELLAQALPTGVKLTVRHLSSTPTRCAALFAAPPGEQPEATSCTNHFLTVSIHKEDGGEGDATTHGPEPGPGSGPGTELVVFGMEVPIYTTAHLTTIFVSKADSTGYLPKPPPSAGKVSLLRVISNTFLSYLVRAHQRAGVRLVLSLFARAQNQYLFPGSIENAKKHVLDDRGLIKWWCRVVDPILREYEPESEGGKDKGLLDRAMEASKGSATAFLIVPGCDRFETRGFYPPGSGGSGAGPNVGAGAGGDRPRWVNSYPVRQLCDNPDAPPRCLIPRLPDDPKTRFLTDLDDELPVEQHGMSSQKQGKSQDQEQDQKQNGKQKQDPDQEQDQDQGKQQEQKKKDTRPPGQWRSVRSLDQFWEMMAFRQECSAGRLVGFLWVVINPVGMENSVQMGNSRSVTTSTLPSEDKPDEQPLYWPETGRGDVVLNEAEYKTALDTLLSEDFDTEEAAITSTKEWTEKLASLADQQSLDSIGKLVEGRATTTSTSTPQTSVNQLSVRKRKKEDGQTQAQGDSETQTLEKTDTDNTQPEQPKPAVNMLGTNLIRKKKKT